MVVGQMRPVTLSNCSVIRNPFYQRRFLIKALMSPARRISLSLAVTVSALILLLTLPAWAQIALGSLQGQVLDSGAAPVSQATVTVSSPAFSVERSVQTNSRGDFRLDDVAPGKYHVVVRAQGFAEATAEIAVVVSSVRDLTVKLRLAPVVQNLNVKAGESSITMQPFDTTRTVQQGMVTSQDLHDIPLAARYGTGGTVRPHKSQNHGGVIRRQLRLERAVVGRWRRQHRRLHRWFFAEFLA